MIKNKPRFFLARVLVTIVIMALVTACGHKSDLFLPGEPTEVDQVSVPVIEDMKREVKENLAKQKSENDGASAAGSQAEGVVVETPAVEIEATVEPEQEAVKKKNTQ